MNKIEIIKTIINILLFGALASSFIGVFFFTYAKNIEQEIVLNNIEYSINELTNDILYILPLDITIDIQKQLNDIKLDDMTEADNKVKKSNKELLKLAFTVQGIFLIIVLGIVISLKLYYPNDISLMQIFSENIILLIAIGIIEFIFLKFIAAQFKAADINKIKYEVISTIIDPNYKPTLVDDLLVSKMLANNNIIASNI